MGQNVFNVFLKFTPVVVFAFTSTPFSVKYFTISKCPDRDDSIDEVHCNRNEGYKK